MTVTQRVMKLSKYMITLPESKISIFLIFTFSFLAGGIMGCLDIGLNMEEVVYSFLSGGATIFFLLGLTTMASGGLVHSAVNLLKKRHMKQKQALFLSFVSMFITCLVLVAGDVICKFIVIRHTLWICNRDTYHLEYIQYKIHTGTYNRINTSDTDVKYVCTYQLHNNGDNQSELCSKSIP